MDRALIPATAHGNVGRLPGEACRPLETEIGLVDINDTPELLPVADGLLALCGLECAQIVDEVDVISTDWFTYEGWLLAHDPDDGFPLVSLVIGS